jgi:hypothetical protein
VPSVQEGDSAGESGGETVLSVQEGEGVSVWGRSGEERGQTRVDVSVPESGAHTFRREAGPNTCHTSTF